MSIGSFIKKKTKDTTPKRLLGEIIPVSKWLKEPWSRRLEPRFHGTFPPPFAPSEKVTILGEIPSGLLPRSKGQIDVIARITAQIRAWNVHKKDGFFNTFLVLWV